MDGALPLSYRSLARIPGLRRVMVAALLGRVGGQMFSVAMVLFALAAVPFTNRGGGGGLRQHPSGDRDQPTGGSATGSDRARTADHVGLLDRRRCQRTGRRTRVHRHPQSRIAYRDRCAQFPHVPAQRRRDPDPVSFDCAEAPLGPGQRRRQRNVCGGRGYRRPLAGTIAGSLADRRPWSRPR